MLKLGCARFPPLSSAPLDISRRTRVQVTGLWRDCPPGLICILFVVRYLSVLGQQSLWMVGTHHRLVFKMASLCRRRGARRALCLLLVKPLLAAGVVYGRLLPVHVWAKPLLTTRFRVREAHVHPWLGANASFSSESLCLPHASWAPTGERAILP